MVEKIWTPNGKLEITIAIWQPSWMYANEAKDQLQRRLSQMIACVETPEYSILNQLNISTENNDMKTYVNMCTNMAAILDLCK